MHLKQKAETICASAFIIFHILIYKDTGQILLHKKETTDLFV